ncbi:alpha-keto acid decarboxylase family protein [Listeria valentina]|uniref:alpha-keto acid decarboxylase family protein n=1 Tax=Listeria valentina TaxID=2705293 RepID=UPI001431ECFA|nr:alpha-keto acid decarboxylase family protein [Listeria valentina]
MYTIGDYLLDRLSELGITEIFGVPGDYNLQFLDKIMANKNLKWVGNANELNAAYMADGYARTRKAAALVTTFGVGELSAMNGIAGSFAENVPVVEIIGSPQSGVQDTRKLVHHTLGDGEFSHFEKMHQAVTAATAHLTKENAPAEIDRVLNTLLETRKPVYLNLPIDVAESPASKPSGELSGLTELTSEDQNLLQEIESAFLEAKQPVVMAGHELASFGLEKSIQKLIEKTQLPVTTLSLGKGVIDETMLSFIGTYSGALSEPSVQNFVDQADLLLLLGVKLSDSVTGTFSQGFSEQNVIALNVDGVSVYGKVTQNHHFEPLIKALADLEVTPYQGDYPSKGSTSTSFIGTDDDATLTQKSYWQAMDAFFQPGDTLIAEQGTSFFGIAPLFLKTGTKFIGQPLWGSIGFTFPAALGSQIANPDSRHILAIGDGSLQLTAQELGVALREKLTPIIFVLNNDGYTVERQIHGAEQSYNDIPMWHYKQLPDCFGGNSNAFQAYQVRTEKELLAAMKEARSDPSRLYWIEVMLEKMDAPEYLQKLGKLFTKQNS